jgi:hypothetical protein
VTLVFQSLRSSLSAQTYSYAIRLIRIEREVRYVESIARESKESRADQIETFKNEVFNFARAPKDRNDGRCIVWLRGREDIASCMVAVGEGRGVVQ